MRARKPGGPGRSRPTGELDIFADPTEGSSSSRTRRVRRNSDSSVLSKNGKLLDPEEEKKRAERRRRERRHRERDAKDGKSRKPDRKLDIIDKLDVTSIYGTGCEYYLPIAKYLLTCFSISSRWTIRCLQPTQKPTRKQTCTDASISKRFIKQCFRRWRTFE